MEKTKLSIIADGVDIKIEVCGNTPGIMTAYSELTKSLYKSFCKKFPKTMAKDFLDEAYRLAFLTQEEMAEEVKEVVKNIASDANGNSKYEELKREILKIFEEE